MKRAIFVCVLVILMICGCVTAVALTQQEEKATVASSTNCSKFQQNIFRSKTDN